MKIRLVRLNGARSFLAGMLLAFPAPFLCPLPLSAEEPPVPANPPTAGAPAAGVVRINESRFRIGEVEFDWKTRAIRFPAAVNMTEGVLEFAVVHGDGKVHESLLRTTINPSQLNVVLMLLRYRASPELFPLMEDGHPTGFYPNVDAPTRAAARVAVRVIWKDGAVEKSAPLNEWIGNAISQKAMAHGPWLYTGSFIHDGRFMADATGDLLAIFISRDAVLSFPGQDNDNDEAWIPQAVVVPPKGTPVALEISPWKP